MDAARLRGMPVTELAGRGRQEAFKWLERVGGTALHRRSPRLARPTPERFFTGPTDPGTPGLVRDRAPEACRAVIAAARAARAGRFDLLGYRELSFGDPIDWHLDPVAQVRAPLIHWSRLDVLDPTQVGDSKVAWELNRHQWLVGLGQAYRLTGEDGFGEAFVAYVTEWLAANPRPRGINWASSLEVALRLISWLWSLFLFGDAPSLSAGFRDRLVQSIEQHASHVARYLSHYFSPNTHLTGEALGLFYAGLLLPDAPPAARWRDHGRQILIGQSARQISPDGAYCEQSTGYARYTAEIFLHALILGARNEVEFPPATARRVESLLDYLLRVRSPNGAMPMIGDADGGWLLPLSGRAPDDLRGVLSTGAAWFGRPDYAWAAGGAVAPETIWLLGVPGLEAFAALSPSCPPDPPSRLFAQGGTAVMRSGWREDAHQLIFDVGPLGAYAHGHGDLLGVQVAAFGEPCVVDPGTYCYTADLEWRDHFRGTAAHSTVTVDGLDQAIATGPFAWQARPAARLRQWRTTPEFDYADAEHSAYDRLTDPVKHRRRVCFAKPRFWLVVDDLDGRASHRVDVRFQFAPLTVELGDGDGWVRAGRGDGPGLLIQSFSAALLQTRTCEGELAPPRGWVAPDYGRRRPAPVLISTVVTELPLRVTTLLVPVPDISAPTPRVTYHPGRTDTIVFEDTGERVYIDAELVSAEARSPASLT